MNKERIMQRMTEDPAYRRVFVDAVVRRDQDQKRDARLAIMVTWCVAMIVGVFLTLAVQNIINYLGG